MDKKISNIVIFKTIKSLLFVTAIFVLYSCTKTEEEPVVATIGEECITATDFVMSYENASGHLKPGATIDTKKRSYLDFMINEKLLAKKGYQLGLEKSTWILAETEELRQELMIDALLEADVRSKIEVTPDEIKEEINKSKVTFKFRYWPENNLENAQKVAQRMREVGYAETVDELQNNNPERRRIDPNQLISEYVDYQQISPEILEAIENLPFGEISDPVEINDNYLIFQVLDIRRSAVTTNEYKSLASRFEQIIFYRKYGELVKKYVVDMMTPLEVKTKADAFNLLAPALVEWEKNFDIKRGVFLLDVQNAADKFTAMVKLRDNFDAVFFTWRDGSVSIGEFLPYFKTRYVNPETAKADDYHTMLDYAIQLSIRDYFTVQRAKGRDLADAPSVQKGLKTWQDKWVFEASASHVTKKMPFTDNDLIEFYTNFNDKYVVDKETGPALDYDAPQVKNDAMIHKKIQLLQQTCDSLRNVFPVKINEAVLDTIQVVRFKNNPWATTRFYRAGTNRPIFPTVSDNWKLANP